MKTKHAPRVPQIYKMIWYMGKTFVSFCEIVVLVLKNWDILIMRYTLATLSFEVAIRKKNSTTAT